MTRFKKFISIMTSTTLLLSGTIATTSFAVSPEGNFLNTFSSERKMNEYLELNTNGVLEETIDVTTLDFYQACPYTNNQTKAPLPASVDLSTSPCFPPLGNQSSLGSCTAFATTYYQFSYEVNKMNNITSVNDQVVYSPKCVYNNLNEGDTDGIAVSDAYVYLNNFGALKENELPYDGNYTYIPGNLLDSTDEMIDEKIEALKTRVSGMGVLTLPDTGTCITSPTDADLNAIKSMINDGKILVITTKTSFNRKNGFGAYSNLSICYRSYTASSGGHAMAVVGYDDNICCDVNGNGTIEECEKGAFKLANSYGTSIDNSGYKWVLYDAINAVSANVTNDWESKLSGTRYQALRFSYPQPTFWYIYVENKDVNYIGEINLNTNYYDYLNIQISRTTSNTSNPIYTNSIKPRISSLTRQYTGKILFDYDSYCYPITNYLSGYKWYVKLSPYSGDSLNARFRIIDDKENEIIGYESENSIMALSNEKYKIINTKIGDMNYNGIWDREDATIIQNNLLGNISISTLQEKLVDANQNGSIDLADAVHILMNLEG